MSPAWVSALLLGAWARAASPAPGALERVFRLEEAVALASKEDSRLQSAEQDTIIAEQRVKEAWFQFLPEFGLQASAAKFDARSPFSPGESRNLLLFPGSPENIYTGRGYMYMPVYEGRRHVNTLHLAQAALQQARANFKSVKSEVALAAKEAFHRLILAQEKLAIASQSEATIGRFAADAALGPLDRLESEALLEEARAAAASARHELELSRLKFLKILNTELDTPFRVEGTLETRAVEIDANQAALWAIELRPELQSEVSKAEMDEISVNLAIGRRHPILFLSGDYELTGHNFPLRQNNWDAMIGVKVPFSYDFLTQVRQKRAERRQGQLRRSELEDRVRLEVRQAHEILRFWQKEWRVRESHHKRLRELFDQAATAAIPALARMRATVRMAHANASHLGSLTEHLIAVARLEWAVGRDLLR